jgi:hypothetical protein
LRSSFWIAATRSGVDEQETSAKHHRKQAQRELQKQGPVASWLAAAKLVRGPTRPARMKMKNEIFGENEMK